ncbi:conserved repeat domain-containing protein [Friedmanniella luteola]|uniref:Conserved repeat domain-containing protein n=1 Tax=Friedmanniella luteola TaxID=546871 RepID=A0A1H1ZE72_9ACTN|nr:DUF11 domain-containing protein [Friedmanniella luteola]SDT31847.1 conserved repeat domain-containing protein [Friedmanniella luteola]
MLSLVLALLVLGTAVLPPVAAEAAVQKPFAKVFSAQNNGAIAIVGNTQLTCQTAATGCTAARSGSGTNTNNNNYTMAFSDVDNVAATTNSTSADLALPADSTVLYARLLWSARLTAGTSGAAGTGAVGTAKFRGPGQSGYTTVNATTVTTTTIDTTPYQASLDVTSTVRTGGNGTYFFADMVAATGVDRYAGWTLVVAYSNPNLPLRDLTVFEGFADITTETAANSTVSTTVSGFITPTAGTVNATVGLGAWEGDLGTTGDVLKFGGTTLSDAARPANNSFDSAISNYGTSISARNPSATNNFGVDMGRISANGVLPNGATSATVSVSTTGDYIYLGLLTTEIDLYTPSFAGVSKTVTNLSGNAPAQVGDTLEYRLSFTNSGQDTAADVVARDTLPAGVSYVPGSTTVVSGANASTTPKTDATGDDVAEYVAADRLVRVRLGTGASATAGGTVAVNGSTAVTFRARVERPAAGTTVVNGALLDYRAVTLGNSYTFTTNTVSTPVQEIADLALTKTSTPTSQTAGSRVTYALGVTNNGPNTATGVVTTDTLPTGVSYLSSAPPSGTTCTSSGQTVTCSTATLANGAAVSIPVIVDVGAGTAAGTLVNTASVAASTTDDVATNNTATASTTVTRDADLRLTKTGPASVAAGNQVVYTLTALNAGPSSATSTTITDTLPLGTTLVSTDPSQGTCSASGQTVICTVGTLAPAATATVTLRATVAASSTATSLDNSASVTSATPDATPANNSATATTAVTQNADLAVTQTANPTTVPAGGTLTYTVTVANTGATDARGVTLADAVPAGLTLLQVTPTQGTCAAGSPLACDLGTITPGSTVRLTLSVRVDASRDAGTVTNTARATTTTAQAVTTNDAASTDITVVTRADVSLTKSAAPNPVQLGSNLTYTLTAANAGPSQARGVVVTDTLPTGTTFVSASTGCTASGRTVTCPMGTLDVGAGDSRTVTVTTPQTAPAGGLSNTAVATAATTDPAETNNTATFVSSTASSADLALTKTTSPSPVVPGRDVTYTLTASNAGPSAATGVVVDDTLPTGVTYASSTVPGGGSCTATGQAVACTVGTLAGGASATITLVGRVNADLVDRSTANTASVRATTPTDPTTSNNTATSTTEIARSADVGVTMVATTPTVRAGEEAGYRVTVNNAGPSTARNVVVTGQVPDGLEPVPGSSGGVCTVTGRTVSCAIGTLPVGSTANLTFRARVLPSTPAGTISGTASIGATTPDPNQADNASVAALEVVTAADVRATSSLSTDVLVAGGTATYTLTAANAGPSDATGVTLTDTVPAGLTVVSVAPSTGSCTVEGQIVRCGVDRLSPGGTLTVRVAVAVAADATGSRSSTVTVGSAVPDPAAGNNSDTTTTPVVQSADLRLTATAAPEPVTAGSTLRYTFGAVNVGPSLATAVVLDQVLPAGVRVLAGGIAAPPGVTCTVAAALDQVRCTLGDLAPGAGASVSVDTQVDPGLADGSSLTARGTLSSPTGDQDPDTRAARVTSSVVTSADLAVTKTARSSSPIAGGQETYVVTVSNAGPSRARAVRVVDSLPDGLTFVSAVNPAGTCSADGSDVTCDLGAVEPGAVVVVQLTTRLAATSAGRAVRNTVRVASDTADPTARNDTASLEQPVSGQNDLQLTKQVTSGPVVAGQPVTYRMVLSNDGPSQARDVILTDVLPDRLTFGRVDASGDGSCVYDPLTQTPADDDQVTCSWGTLDVGGSVTVTLTLGVPVDQPTGQPVVNTATASASATDPTPATATVSSAVGSRADLSVRKSLLSGPPTPGQEVRWQVSVQNDGPSVARDVRVRDAAPAGVAFTGAEAGQGSCPVAADAVECVLGDVAVGATVTVTVSGLLAAGSTVTDLTNEATVSSTTTDPDPDDNTTSVTTPATASADLALTSTAPASVVAGQQLTWTFRVTDEGPSDARDLRLTTALPDGVTVLSSTLDGPGSCSGTPSPTCTVDDLAAGASRTLTVVARVNPGYAGTALLASARVASAVADPDPLDGTTSSTTRVGRSADLSVSQTGPAVVAAGGTATWTVRVTNDGPSDGTGLVVVDDLPADLLGLTGTSDGGTCTLTGQQLLCPLGVVTAGGSRVITVTGQVDPATTAATLTNEVTVAADTPDPDTADLSSTFVTTIARSSDLTVTSTPGAETFTAGGPVSWTLTVRDGGPSVAREVVLTDTLPEGVTLATVDAGGGTCRLEGTSVLVCSFETQTPGTPIRVQVRGTLDAGATQAALVNSATVRAGTPDPDLTGNAASSSTPVGQSANLSIAQLIGSGRPVAGQPISSSLLVRNAGPSVARAVAVRSILPVDIEDPTVVSTSGTCTLTGRDLLCTVPELAPGAEARIDLGGVLAADFSGELSSVAAVESSTPDPDLADNTARVATTADEQAELSVVLTGPDRVVAGERVRFTVTVTNDGPSDARGVRLLGLLPAGVTDVRVESAYDPCTPDGQCPIGDLAADASRTIVVSGLVPADSSATSLNSTAVLTSDTADLDTTDNTSRVVTEVTRTADLVVTTASDVAQLTPGRGATLTVTVRNDGPSTARQVSATDTLPEGLALAGDPTSSAGACTTTGRTVTCELDQLEPGGALVLTLPVTVGASFTGATVADSASATSATPDPDAQDNTDAVTLPVRGRADLTLLSSAPDEVRAGTPLSWTLDLANDGPSDAQATVITQTLPAGVGRVSLASTQGSCTQSGVTVTCTLGVVAAGQAVRVTVGTSGVLDPSYPAGPVVARATVSSPTADPDGDVADDPTPDGRSASSETRVVAEADVTVTTVATPTSTVAGGPVGWTVTVSSTGPSTARDVVLTNPLPDDVRGFTLVPADGVTCSGTTCTIGDLRPGTDQALVFTVRGTVPAAFAGDAVVDTARVSTSTPDPDPGDDRASAPVAVQQAGGVALVLDGPDTVVPGEDVSWTVTVTNLGPSLARGVVVTDALPTGVTGARVSAPAGVRCTDGPTLSCDLGSLDVGDQNAVTLVVTGRVAADLADPELATTARVTATTPDPDSGDNAATAVSLVRPEADLALVKTGPAAATAGEAVAWELEVSNDGPSQARDVVVLDTLPAGVGGIAAGSPEGGVSCTVEGAGIRCAVGALDPDDAVTVQVTGVVDAGQPAGTLENVATVSSAATDVQPADNRDATRTEVTSSADLSVTKTVSPDPLEAGSPATFVLTVANAGPSRARAAVVTDVLPAGLTAGAVTSTSGTCAVRGQTVACDLGDLAATGGTPVVVTIPVVVADDVDPDGFANTASVQSDTTDPDAGDNSAVVAGEAASRADLRLTKTADRTVAVPGELVTWTLAVTNDGPSAARAVSLVDTLPASVAVTAASVPGGSCAPLDVRPLVCTLDVVRADQTVAASITGRVDADTLDAALTNAASVGSTGSVDPDAADNSDQVRTPLQGAADLVVEQSATPTPAVAGAPVTWTVTVRNTGPSQARGVVLTDTVPVGVDVTSATLDRSGDCRTLDGSVTCDVGTLATGSSAVLTLVGRPTAGSAGGDLVNRAVATAVTQERTPNDNDSRLSTPLGRSADLSVALDAPTRVLAGEQLTWRVTVRNDGPSDAAGATTRLALPPGLLGLTAVVDGTGCPVTADGTLCALGALPAGEQRVLVVTGQLDPASLATALPATATAAATTADPDTADLTATGSTTVGRAADLALTKRVEGAVVAGRAVTWSLVLTNPGPSTARDVVLTDALPAGVRPATATSGDADCAVADGTLRCTRDQLAPGGTVQVRVTGTLDPAYPDTGLRNTASATTSTPDPVPGGSSATSDAEVGASADLRVGKALTSGLPVAGEPITFTVVVTNDGPSDATGVVLTDVVPSQVRAVTAGSDAGTCTVVGPGVRCDLGTLADGAEAVVTVGGVVTQTFDERLTNTARVTSATPDPDPGNDAGSADASVGESAAVSVALTGPATATAGGPLRWTLVVRNAGPSTARDVDLAQLLPAGVRDVAVDDARCRPDVSCLLGDLAPGATVTVVVTGTLDPAFAGGELDTAATVTSPTADPSSVDDTATWTTAVGRASDLVTTLDLRPGTLVPGTGATLVVGVRNAGPSTADRVVLSTTLPEGLTLAADATGDGATCTLVGRTLRCTVPALAPGADVAVTVPLAVAPGVSVDTLDLSAVASSLTPMVVAGDNTATRAAPVAGQADLTLSKTGPATASAGTPLAWRLVLTNDGPSDAQGVVLTDALPAGVGPVTVTASQGVCAQQDDQVRCDVGQLADDGRVTVDLVTTGPVDPSTVTGVLTNRAAVTSATGEPGGGSGGRRDAASTDLGAIADVAVDVRADAAAVTAGTRTSWTVTVANRGPATARGVRLALPAGAGLTDVRVSGPAGLTCTDVCTLATLLPGDEAAVVLTVSARVPAGSTADSVTTRATVSAATDDPENGDDTDAAAVPVVRSAALAVSKTGDRVVTPGGDVAWSVVVENAGPSVARDVRLTDALPDGVSDVEVAGAGCTGTDTVSCALATLDPDESVELTLTGRLASGFEADALTNTAEVTSSTSDPDAADNSDTARGDTAASADLSVTKTGPETLVAGGPVVWRLTVANDGPSTARGVVLSDPVPAGVGRLRTSGADCAVVDRVVRCDLDAVADGDEVTVTVSGVVDPAYTGAALVNAASVRSDTADPEPANGTSDPVSTTVTRSADLSIVKTVDDVVAGEDAVFTLTVRNAGPSTARGVVVTDVLPAGLGIGEVSGAACAVEGQTVTCRIAELGPTGDEPVVVTIPVAVADDVDPATLVNTATVQGSDPDPQLDDNTSVVAGGGVAVADLAVTKVADREAAAPGERVSWTVTARNAGPSAARDVTIRDVLPDDLTDLAVEGPAGACAAVVDRVLTCTLDVLRDGELAAVVVRGTVASGSELSALTNSVTIASSASRDPETDDNAAQVTTPLTGEADVALTKVLDTVSPGAGEEARWTLTATNRGPSTARGVVLTDTLPAVPVVAELPTGCTAVDRTVSCGLGDLEVGASGSVELVGTVESGATGTLSNSATVTATSPDLDLADNTATTPPAPLRHLADLGVAKVADATEASVGDEVGYVVTVTNRGPSDASGVMVDERWPDGLALVGAEPGTGRFDPATMTWAVGTLAAGASAELRLAARVSGTGVVTNAVAVSGGDGTVDPEPDDGVADATLTVDPPADPGDPDQPGQPGQPGQPAQDGPPGPGIPLLPRTGGPVLWVLVLGWLAVVGGVSALAVRRRRG